MRGGEGEGGETQRSRHDFIQGGKIHDAGGGEKWSNLAVIKGGGGKERYQCVN